MEWTTHGIGLVSLMGYALLEGPLNAWNEVLFEHVFGVTDDTAVILRNHWAGLVCLVSSSRRRRMILFALAKEQTQNISIWKDTTPLLGGFLFFISLRIAARFCMVH